MRSSSHHSVEIPVFLSCTENCNIGLAQNPRAATIVHPEPDSPLRYLMLVNLRFHRPRQASTRPGIFVPLISRELCSDPNKRSSHGLLRAGKHQYMKGSSCIVDLLQYHASQRCVVAPLLMRAGRSESPAPVLTDVGRRQQRSLEFRSGTVFQINNRLAKRNRCFSVRDRSLLHTTFQNLP